MPVPAAVKSPPAIVAPSAHESPEFTAEILRIAADVLDESALVSGSLSVTNSVQLRLLATHLRGLAEGGA